MQKLNSPKCQPSLRRRTPQQVASPLRVEGRWVERLSCDGLSDSGKAKRKKDARDLVKGAVTALSHPNPIANSDSFQAYFGRAKAIFDFKTATWRFREQQRSGVQRKNDCTAGYGWPCYNDWFAVDIMAGFVASSQSNAVVKYFTRGECEGVCPEANLVTIPRNFFKTVLNKIKSKKIPPKSEIKNSGRNKPRGENANAGIIVCKGHAETLKAVICHLDQSKCAMLDLSKEGCGQIWSLVVTRISNDVFQQNLHVWIG